MTDYKVTFLYKGSKITVHGSVKNEPKAVSDAEVVAWATVRAWFEDEHKPLPELVRNVNYLGAFECSWSLLPTADSTPKK